MRTSVRAAKADDALARDKERQVSNKLEQLGLTKEGEMPISLGALLRQAGTPLVGNINSGFGGDDFGGFDGDVMDYESDSEWEVESGDELEDELKQSAEKPSDYAIRTQKEVDNWTNFIAIVTGDTTIQECSPFCTCSKSIRSIPTVSLSAGVLNHC